MNQIEKDEVIQTLVNKAMSQPTLEEYGRICIETLNEFGAFKPLEDINMSLAIKGKRIVSI